MGMTWTLKWPPTQPALGVDSVYARRDVVWTGYGGGDTKCYSSSRLKESRCCTLLTSALDWAKHRGHSGTQGDSFRYRVLPCHVRPRCNVRSIDRCRETSLRAARASAGPARSDRNY